MPSIAGIAIVSWFCAIDPKLKEILFFGLKESALDTGALVLLVLYGNLFCYVSSYPILVFHSTRSIDFKGYQWRPCITDGYIATALLLILCVGSGIFFHGVTRIATICLLVVIYSGLQVVRIYRSLKPVSIPGWKTRTYLQYFFLVSLSKRRGRLPIKTTTTNEDEDVSETTEEQNKWRQEIVDSYKHMREHGNSAFIFALEITLATICYATIFSLDENGFTELAILAAIFVLWSFPAVLVHFLGQHIERRYAKSDDMISWNG